jgi:putative DNA primase/helicase
MINGCVDWQRIGLIRPASVKTATEAYFSDQDLFGQWLDDCCDIRLGDSKLWDKTANLFESWTEYAVKAGESPGSKKAFSQSLVKRQFLLERIEGHRAFRFVRVKAEDPSDFG